MFHAQEGLFFGRQEDGAVRIVKKDGPLDEGKIEMDITLDSNIWASAICSVCHKGETPETFITAGVFHNGIKRIGVMDNERHVLENQVDIELLCPKCQNEMKEYVNHFACRVGGCGYVYSNKFQT